jgi:hypothetical protein
VLYGVLLLIVVFVMPGGVIDGIRRLRTRVVRIRPNPSWLPGVERVHRPVGTDVTDELHNEAPATPNTPP